MSRTLACILLALSAGVAIGCGGRQTPAPDDVVTDAQAVFEAMSARLVHIESVRIRADVELYSRDGRGRVQQAVLARAPADLRIETLSPFDTSLAVFMVHQGALTFFDLQRGELVRGPATPENIARFVPFYLTPSDIVRILSGGAPTDGVDPDPAHYTVRWDRHAGAYALDLPLREGGALRVFVQHATWAVSGATHIDAGGDVRFTLRAGRFFDVEADGVETVMPRALRFEMRSERLDISLDVERLDLNPALPDALFTLPPPPGVTVRELDPGP